MTEPFQRPSGRTFDALRTVTIQPDIAPHALGSVLIGFGNTRVICAACVESRVPKWMNIQGVSGGWLTAEYSMLPYSTLDRKDRDISRGKLDGRTVEIQRLIGRSLRAVVDLSSIHGKTLWLDCDVLQADGGTRTASITGAWLASAMAVERLIRRGDIPDSPLKDHVAAISVGLVQGQPILDLDYPEDRDASVDFNVVMTGGGDFVEVQGTGEEAVFNRSELDALLELAGSGITELVQIQRHALEKWKSETFTNE